MLSHLATVLAGYSYRVPAFLHQTGVIHNPGRNRTIVLHGRQSIGPHRFQHVVITPRGLGHDMVQGLVGLADVVGKQPCGHGFHALALSWQQQTGAIRFQGSRTIGMPCGQRQAIEIGRKAFFLGAWRYRVGAHEQQGSMEISRSRIFSAAGTSLYNTVVLGMHSITTVVLLIQTSEPLIK